MEEEAPKRIVHKHIEFPAGPECHFVPDSVDICHLRHVELDYLNPKGVLQLLDRLEPSCRGKDPESCSRISPCNKVTRDYSRKRPLAWNSFASSPPIPPMPALNRQCVSHCPHRGMRPCTLYPVIRTLLRSVIVVDAIMGTDVRTKRNKPSKVVHRTLGITRVPNQVSAYKSGLAGQTWKPHKLFVYQFTLQSQIQQQQHQRCPPYSFPTVGIPLGFLRAFL